MPSFSAIHRMGDHYIIVYCDSAQKQEGLRRQVGESAKSGKPTLSRVDNLHTWVYKYAYKFNETPFEGE